MSADASVPSPEDADGTPSRRTRRRRREIAWGIPAIVVAVSVAVLPHLDVYTGGIVPVLQSLVPVGAVALAVFALVLLIFWARAAGVVLLVGALVAALPTLTPTPAAVACADPTPLTVLSFNAKFAGADPAQLADLVRSEGADVVVLVETDETLIDAVLRTQGLDSTLRSRTAQVSPGGVSGSVILSAYPLSKEERIPGSVFDQVTAVAALPGGGEVRLAAVHPPPPVGQPADWHDGVTALHSWIDRTPDARLVVAGDLNSSFSHPVFRTLASSLSSAAAAAGPIPWPTWPEEKPVPAFTAIDHILARGATPTRWASFHIDGSDHRAVVGSWNLCAPARTG